MSPLPLFFAALLAAAPLTLDEVRAAGRQNVEALRAALDAEKAAQGKRLSLSPILPQLGLQTGLGYTALGPQRQLTTKLRKDEQGNPVLDANGDPVFEQRVGDVDGSGRGSFTLSLTLTQLLYDGGKWWNEIARAGAADEAARGQLAEQQLASEFESIRRFWELLRAQATRDVLRASIDRSRQQLERAQSLFQAGRAQKRDALDAEINLGTDRISALRQEDAIVRSRGELLKWIARPSAKVEAVDPGAHAHPALPAGEALLARARAQRPLLASLKAREKVAERAIDVAWAGYLPRVSGSLGYQRNAPGADPFFTDFTKQHALNIGVQLSWDIFSGFSTTAQVQSARQDLRVAQLATEQAERELASDLEVGEQLYARAEEILAIVEQNLALARQSLALAEDRYSAGAATSLEVRDAQVKLTQAQLSALQGRIDVEVARASVLRLTGSLEDAP